MTSPPPGKALQQTGLVVAYAPVGSAIVVSVPKRCLQVVLFIGAFAAGCTREQHAPTTPIATSQSSALPAVTRTPDRPADFWVIIDATAGLPEPTQLQRLRQSLESMPPEDIERFQTEFQKRLAQSYTWDLWGAAYLINGGCSDDCFEYFRAWLVTRGQRVFVAALNSPDSLADLPNLPQEVEFEAVMYVAGDVYKAKTGRDLPATDSAVKRPELGPGWDFDDPEEARRRLPKLSKRMLQSRP